MIYIYDINMLTSRTTVVLKLMQGHLTLARLTFLYGWK